MIKLTFLFTCIAMSIVMNAAAQNLKNYQWKNRVVLIFGDEVDEPLVRKQYTILNAEKAGLKERDLLIFVNPESKSMTSLSNKAGFEVILVGKDGGVKKRKTELMTTDELFAIIDAMPMRQSEMRRH